MPFFFMHGSTAIVASLVLSGGALAVIGDAAAGVTYGLGMAAGATLG